MMRPVMTRIVDVAVNRPRMVLLGVLALTIGAAFLGSRVELRTSRTDMVDRSDPDQRRAYPERAKSFWDDVGAHLDRHRRSVPKGALWIMVGDANLTWTPATLSLAGSSVGRTGARLSTPAGWKASARSSSSMRK